MLMEAIIISLVIGLIRGGKLKNFKRVNSKTKWSLICGILIQYIIVFLSKSEEISGISKILSYSKEILILSYILILIGLIGNINFRSLWIVILGFIGNFLVFAMNNWKIPILTEGIGFTDSVNLREVIETGASKLYTPIVEGIKYPILGDIIIFAKPYPIPKIISIGDLLIAFGIFSLIQEIMLGKDSFMRGYRL